MALENQFLNDNKNEMDMNFTNETNSSLYPKPVISFTDIACAAFQIRKHVIRTPLTPFDLREPAGMNLYLKKEYTQITGSFKERGACYALMKLSDSQKQRGVVTASLGNHSQALSYHANQQGIPATVVMPVVAPLVKVEACKRFGANAIVEGDNMNEAKEYAHQYCNENDLTYINGYDDPYIIAGQGTIALEIFEDMPDVEGIIVPVGGGGLIAGIALAAKTLNKNIKIIGVESERCPSFSQALKHGEPVMVESRNSIADGLAVAKVGTNAFNIAAPLIDKMVVVKEEWISLTILRLMELEKCVVEGAGAAGLAAVLCGELQEYKGMKLAIVLCGGNIDSNILGRCIERSLAADGRLLKFSVTISDRPGGVSDVCGILAKLGVSIKDIVHERAWLTSEVFHVNVIITCETRDENHVKEVKETLVKYYTNVFFDNLPMLRL